MSIDNHHEASASSNHEDQILGDDFSLHFDRLMQAYVASSNQENQGTLSYYDEDWPSPCVALHNAQSDLIQDALVNWQPVKRISVDSSADSSADSKENSAASSTMNSAMNNEIDSKMDKQANTLNLNNIESALDITLPPQAHELFCRYFSHDINAQAEQGPLVLLQAWNEQDFDRLQKNIIAHIMMKRRLKQADTVFFALTDKDDLLLSILLETGEVVLEVVGKEPHQIIAANLTEFMASLRPQAQLVRL